MTLKLTISSAKLDPKVNYRPFNINERPFIQSQSKEVTSEKTSPNKMTLFGSTFVLGLIPTIASAQTTSQESQIISETLNPQVMFEFSMRIALIGLAASVGTTIVFLMASGIRKQLGGEKNRRKSKEWNTDIIKGFAQCLVAIPVVFALYYLATTIFSQLEFSGDTFLKLP